MIEKKLSSNQWYFVRLTAGSASHPGIRRSVYASLYFWLLVLLFLVGNPAWAEIKEGDILVVDQIGGAYGQGSLIQIDKKTGRRTELTDFGNPEQGMLGSAPASVAVDSEGWIYVSDLFGGDPEFFTGGALFEVDPDTGYRSLISNFAQGKFQGNFSYGLAVDKHRQLLAHVSPSSGDRSTIVRINPDTDSRRIVTDLANPAQGSAGSFRYITDLASERSGKIVFTSYSFEGGVPPALFRTHPETGKRTLLSDLRNPSQGVLANFSGIAGLAIEASGKILLSAVVDEPGTSAILRIHPKSGRRTVLSDFGNPDQGEEVGDTFGELTSVAIEKSGTVLVLGVTRIENDPYSDKFSVFRVNPKTGRRTLLSDSHDLTKGTPIEAGTYLAVVPEIRNQGGHHCEKENHDRGGNRHDHSGHNHHCNR